MNDQDTKLLKAILETLIRIEKTLDNIDSNFAKAYHETFKKLK